MFSVTCVGSQHRSAGLSWVPSCFNNFPQTQFSCVSQSQMEIILYNNKIFISHQQYADSLLLFSWAFENTRHSYALLVASQLCNSTNFTEGDLHHDKRKKELLFPLIYTSDFSKSNKSNKQGTLFVCFGLCLIAHIYLITADRVMLFQFLKYMWKPDFTWVQSLLLPVHNSAFWASILILINGTNQNIIWKMLGYEDYDTQHITKILLFFEGQM